MLSDFSEQCTCLWCTTVCRWQHFQHRQSMGWGTWLAMCGNGCLIGGRLDIPANHWTIRYSSFHALAMCCTRVIRKVRRLIQLGKGYSDHILPLFNIFLFCPTFLQSSDSIVESILILVFRPAVCHANYEGHSASLWSNIGGQYKCQ